MTAASMDRNRSRFALARMQPFIARLAEAHRGLSEFDKKLAPMWAFVMQGVGTIDTLKVSLRKTLDMVAPASDEQPISLPDSRKKAPSSKGGDEFRLR